jgi:hypothetical protein
LLKLLLSLGLLLAPMTAEAQIKTYLGGTGCKSPTIIADLPSCSADKHLGRECTVKDSSSRLYCVDDYQTDVVADQYSVPCICRKELTAYGWASNHSAGNSCGTTDEVLTGGMTCVTFSAGSHTPLTSSPSSASSHKAISASWASGHRGDDDIHHTLPEDQCTNSNFYVWKINDDGTVTCAADDEGAGGTVQSQFLKVYPSSEIGTVCPTGASGTWCYGSTGEVKLNQRLGAFDSTYLDVFAHSGNERYGIWIGTAGVYTMELTMVLGPNYSNKYVANKQDVSLIVHRAAGAADAAACGTATEDTSYERSLYHYFGDKLRNSSSVIAARTFHRQDTLGNVTGEDFAAGDCYWLTWSAGQLKNKATLAPKILTSVYSDPAGEPDALDYGWAITGMSLRWISQ